jgi:hypothetical protein
MKDEHYGIFRTPNRLGKPREENVGKGMISPSLIRLRQAGIDHAGGPREISSEEIEKKKAQKIS